MTHHSDSISESFSDSYSSSEISSDHNFNTKRIEKNKNERRMSICSNNELYHSSDSEGDTKTSRYFKVTSKLPGICIVFNFENYYNYLNSKLQPRTGSQYDVYSLKRTFKEINFDVFIYKDLSENEFCHHFRKIQIEDYSHYGCIAIFLLCHGTDNNIMLSDGTYMDINKIFDVIKENISLTNKPKLIFVQKTTKPIIEISHNRKYSNNDFFVFYSFNGIDSFRSGSIFIQELCKVLDRYHYGYDLMQMAGKVVEAMSEKDPIFPPMKIPVFYSTLTRPLFFESNEEDLPLQPDNGRLVILNISKNNFELSNLVNFYDTLKFSFKTYGYEYLDYGRTKKILQRESKNDTNNCNFLLILIYASCGDQRFKTRKNYMFEIESVWRIFEKENFSEKSKSLKKYIFINSIVDANEAIQVAPLNYYYKLSGNILISYNTHPVNFAINLLNIYNYPVSSNVFSKWFTPSDVKIYNQLDSLLIDHFTNTVESSDYKNLHNLKFDKYSQHVYKSRENGVRNITAIVLNNSHANNQIEKIKSMSENFYFSLKIKSSTDSVKRFLTNDIGDCKNIDCLILFIFAHCKNNEIVQKKNVSQIEDFIDLLNVNRLASGLKGKPKLIFIQNLGDENFAINFNLQKDFLLVLIPAKCQATFINNFCDLLKNHSSEYDLMSILHKCNLMSADRLIYIRSTLTKYLFLKRKLTEKDKKSIKSLDLFYRSDKGRCLILKYEKFSDNSGMIRDLKKAFQNFSPKVHPTNNESLENMIKNGTMKNHHDYSGFFVILILDDTSNSAIIHQLIEHFAECDSLVGKPKVLFVLGSILQHGENKKQKTKPSSKIFETDFLLPKHADIFLFCCEQIEEAINSIRKIFNSENIQNYDLMNLLTMVSLDIRVSTQDKEILNRPIKNIQTPTGNDDFIQEIVEPIIEINEQKNMFEDKSQCAVPYSHKEILEQQMPHLPYINSTLTRLVSLHCTQKTDFRFPVDVVSLPKEKKLRGKCVIFSYEKFSIDVIERIGNQKDVEILKETFEMMGFEIEDIAEKIKSNQEQSELTVAHTWREIKEIKCNGLCLVVCFLTHGNSENELSCSDGNIKRDEILNCIALDPNLKFKIKIFLFQACRGDDYESSWQLEESRKYTDMVHKPNSPLVMHPDMFAFFSTYEGHASFRFDDGSWFIQKFCEYFKKYYNQYDLFTISAIICREVSKRELNVPSNLTPLESICLKQIPTFCSTLTQSYSFAL